MHNVGLLYESPHGVMAHKDELADRAVFQSLSVGGNFIANASLLWEAEFRNIADPGAPPTI